MEIEAILDHAKKTIEQAKEHTRDGLFGLRCDASIEDLNSIKSLILEELC